MQKIKPLFLVVVFLALALSACGGASADATPTLSMEQVQTLAVFTFQAGLTQTALAQPTETPTPTMTASPQATFSLPTGNATQATTTSGGGLSACYNSVFVTDVTIPDETAMTPGKSFTKTWRMSNNGTCAWEPGFKWNIVGGDSMGGVAVTLNQRVEPGKQIDISVPMVAPDDTTGLIEGTWRLSDANGNYFGDTPWVKVIVGDATVAATSTADTATPTETPTETLAP